MEVWLRYSAALVSTKQQSESAINWPKSPPKKAFFNEDVYIDLKKKHIAHLIDYQHNVNIAWSAQGNQKIHMTHFITVVHNSSKMYLYLGVKGNWRNL